MSLVAFIVQFALTYKPSKELEKKTSRSNVGVWPVPSLVL